MNALVGSVKIFPVFYTVWYEYQDCPGVQTDAHLIAQDGELYLISSGYETKIVHQSEVKRIVTDRIAQREEMYIEECMQYEAEEWE